MSGDDIQVQSGRGQRKRALPEAATLEPGSANGGLHVPEDIAQFRNAWFTPGEIWLSENQFLYQFRWVKNFFTPRDGAPKTLENGEARQFYRCKYYKRSLRSDGPTGSGERNKSSRLKRDCPVLMELRTYHYRPG